MHQQFGLLHLYSHLHSDAICQHHGQWTNSAAKWYDYSLKSYNEAKRGSFYDGKLLEHWMLLLKQRCLAWLFFLSWAFEYQFDWKCLLLQRLHFGYRQFQHPTYRWSLLTCQLELFVLSFFDFITSTPLWYLRTRRLMLCSKVYGWRLSNTTVS